MPEPPLEVSCQQLQQWIQSEKPLRLVDCREPDEHTIAAIPGATLIPMGEVPSRLAELNKSDEPLVVYCHHGMRSQRVATWLREAGITNAQSLAGGIDAWSIEVDPALPRY